MNGWYLAAGGFSLFTALTHFVLGGREIARPLLACAALAPVPKYTNYYTWHMVSILLFAMAGLFIYAGFYPAEKVVPLSQTALAFLFALLSIALVAAKRMKPLHMPQWALFLPIVLCGVTGLMQ